MQNNIGINNDGIDKIALDIYGYAERISKTLNQIIDVIDRTKEFYICEEATNYRNKFENFKTNFNIINKNIISYADDFIKLKSRFEGINSDMSFYIKQSTGKIENRDYK